MTQSEILKATDRFFTKQPFWDITRKRTDTYLRIEDETVRIIRYGMNEGTEGLDCIPGVGQIGIMFSVQEKRSKSIPLRGASGEEDPAAVWDQRKCTAAVLTGEFLKTDRTSVGRYSG